MPQRPRQHVLETESRLAFERVSSPRFVYRQDVPDYSVDGDVEEFADGVATGLRFYVQLKATDEEDPGKALKVSLSLDKVSYYRSLPLPILMVLHHAPTDTIYVRWFHQFDPYYGGLGQRYLTFRWEPEDVWDEDTPDRLVADARAFQILRRSDLDLPFRIHVERPADGAFGFSAAELGLAVRRAAARRADIIEVVLDIPPPGAAVLRFRKDEIHANLANVTTATMHVDDYEPASGEQLGSDAILVLTLAFEHVGQPDIAARLAATYLPDSLLVGNPDVFGALSYSMARARRVLEALELSERLDQGSDPEHREASLAFTIPALYYPGSLSRDELARYRDTLRARMERRLAAGERVEASREALNLGNSYRTNAEPREAAEMFEKAGRLDPAYQQRVHYWEEYGGALFGSHRYDEAADAYQRALDLGADDAVRHLYADALLFAGHYRQSLDELRVYNEAHPDPEQGQWRLKELLLRHIIEELGIEEQKRNSERAHELAGAAEEAEREGRSRAVLREALGHDALCPLAWFNLGHDDRDDREHALIDYLAAAMFSEWDVEAWGNAILLTMELQAAAIGSDIFLTAERFVGADNLMENFIRYAEAREEGFPAESFLRAMEESLAQIPRPPEPRFILRALGEGSTVESLELPAHRRRADADPEGHEDG